MFFHRPRRKRKLATTPQCFVGFFSAPPKWGLYLVVTRRTAGYPYELNWPFLASRSRPGPANPLLLSDWLAVDCDDRDPSPNAPTWCDGLTDTKGKKPVNKIKIGSILSAAPSNYSKPKSSPTTSEASLLDPNCIYICPNSSLYLFLLNSGDQYVLDIARCVRVGRIDPGFKHM